MRERTTRFPCAEPAARSGFLGGKGHRSQRVGRPNPQRARWGNQRRPGFGSIQHSPNLPLSLVTRRTSFGPQLSSSLLTSGAACNHPAITGAFDNDCILSRCVQKGLPELSRFCQNDDRQYVACLFLWWQQFERRLLRCASSVSCRARKDVISARRSRRMTTLR